MSVAARISAAFRARIVSWLMGPQNRYEGAVIGGRGRSYIPAFVRDARFDADQMTRWELVRKARYFERNNAIVNRLADLFEQFTVGPNGIAYIPTSSEEVWNQDAQEWWDGWCPLCDLTSLMPMCSVQSLAARAWFIDGEVFILKTRGRDRENEASRPRIQLIEGHRVGTPMAMMGGEGSRIFDGIEVDGRGRPIAYWVADGVNGDEYRRVPADQVVHIFEPSRPGQMRGLPFLYPVLNDLHDLDDLQILESQAAKKNADTTQVIKTESGEITEDDEAMLRGKEAQTSVPASSSEDYVKDRYEYYQKVLGASVKVLKHGDSLEEFKSDRPTVASREYWDYLTSKICAGVGISKLLVFPWSMQGTVTRADLDVANAFFRARSSVLGAAFGSIYVYAMGWAIQNERALVDPPADWRSHVCQPPRAVNVDVGHNSKAVIEELRAGTRTFQNVFAELGLNWRREWRQRFVEADYALSLKEEFPNVGLEMVSTVLQDMPERIMAEALPGGGGKPAAPKPEEKEEEEVPA